MIAVSGVRVLCPLRKSENFGDAAWTERRRIWALFHGTHERWRKDSQNEGDPPIIETTGKEIHDCKLFRFLVSRSQIFSQELSSQEFDLSIYNGLELWVDNLPSQSRGRGTKEILKRGKSVLSRLKTFMVFLCEKYQLKTAEEAERYLLVDNPPALLAYCNSLTEREVGPSTVANHLGELKDWLNFVAAERRLYCKANSSCIHLLFYLIHLVHPLINFTDVFCWSFHFYISVFLSMFPAVELMKLVEKQLLLYRREKKEIAQGRKTASLEKKIREGSWPRHGMQELIE